MKLKHWLLVSYLIVMILPLVAAYFLFAWINSYNDEQKVAEYIKTSNQLQAIKAVLDDPELYDATADKGKIDELANEQLSIFLYNQDGLVLYTSNPLSVSAHSHVGKERLYIGLYHLDQGYRTYSYKQPVFENQKIVGFFHVQIARHEWMSGVNQRSSLMFAGFIGLFLAIYVTVILLVNKKLNKRLTRLMSEMTAFASGKNIQETIPNNDEIGQLQQRFHKMKTQINMAKDVIEQEQKAKEYLIATISHDLKTPLTSIKAYAESLREGHLTTEEQFEYQDVIIDKSNFMKHMLDDLLTYTLLESPTYELELVQVEGNEFFEMLVSDYEPLCKKKALHLHCEIKVRGMYDVHPKQLIRVVDNLMSNAIQHAPYGGSIWVAAISIDEPILWLFDFVFQNYSFNFDENVYVIIQNEGDGIAEDKLAHVFTPHFQADQARSKQNDHRAGLGLSITKRIIEKHDGDVEIFSELGRGTCVICRIPKIEGKDSK